ncbi:MAG TPA: heavy-metal-associated domain-containing protein [Candidatus Eisenbacteria bacterium]|nr:heavy-metal-associated domain-containing protein [Candidatus Eisenbacteria bacterium]
MSRAILEVPDISCEHCERTVREALEPLPGVRQVDVDIRGKTVVVDFDETAVDMGRISATLAEEDYPAAAARSL